MNSDLVIPSAKELETLSPAQLWDIEDAANAISERAGEMLDEYLREWVEVEGKTYREIGEMVGRDNSRISRRCSRLGIKPQSKRGGNRFAAPAANETKDEQRITDAEVVDDEEEEVLDGEIVEGDEEASARPAEDPTRALLEQIIWWVSDCPEAVNRIPVEDIVADTSSGELHEWRSGFAKGMTALRALRRRLESPE